MMSLSFRILCSRLLAEAIVGSCLENLARDPPMLSCLLSLNDIIILNSIQNDNLEIAVDRKKKRSQGRITTYQDFKNKESF